MPNATCLKKSEYDNIRTFVENGGNIISTFESSLHSETGSRLDNFALKDVFGIESPGDIFGPLNWDYLSSTGNQHFSLKEIRNRFLNAPTYGIKVKTNSKCPLCFCKPLPGSYAGSPEISDLPFMVENSFGKGKSVYIAGTFGGSLKKFHFPEYYQLLQNLVSEFSEPVVTLKNAPSSVEITVRRNEHSIFIYLINFTSELRRPIQEIIPCPDIGLNIIVPQKVKRLRSLSLSKNLNFTVAGNSVSFALPILNDYDVIQIEI
jgi:hypothetical protein